MPELPEVETTVKGLRTKVLQRTFVDVWSDWEKTIKKPQRFNQFKKELKGKKIVRVWRRAKNVMLELSGGYTLLIHMKMTGHILHGTWSMKHGIWVADENGPLREKTNSYLHIIFFLDNKKMIALSDMRKFAKIELWKTAELLASQEFKSLGPEPLEKSFTLQKFKNIWIGKRGKVKQVLMRPDCIAGIGNIYASESLWLAKIHPQKDISKLDKKELKALYLAIKKVLSKGIALGGDSFSDYRNVDGKEGNFDQEQKVYQREGKKCFRCKTLIKRVVIGARSSFFCQNCQKL